MHETLDKAKVLGLIQVEHAFTVRTIGMLSEEQLQRPNVVGQWSGKDIVAHLNSWHRRFMRWMNEYQAGRTPVMPEAGHTWEKLNMLNDACRERDRSLPLARVVADFDRTLSPILAFLEGLSETQLIEGGQFATMPWPLHDLLAHNTYLHYLEHIPKFRAAICR